MNSVPHLLPEEIGRAANGLPLNEERKLHLRDCDQCRKDVIYATNTEAQWQADRNSFGTPVTTVPNSNRRKRFGLHRRSLVMAAVVLAVVAAGVWSQLGVSDSALGGAEQPIMRAAQQAARTGSFIIPDGTPTTKGLRPAYRSGYVETTPELSLSLNTLATAYNDDKTTAEQTRWLIAGYILTGHIDNARVYLDHARTDHPRDRQLQVLEGVLLFCENKLGDAEGALRRPELRNNEIAQLNLAVVLGQSGKRPEAVEILDRIAATTSDPLLASAALDRRSLLAPATTDAPQ